MEGFTASYQHGRISFQQPSNRAIFKENNKRRNNEVYMQPDETTAQTNIDTKYIEMVERFKAVPVNKKNVKVMLNRYKMMDKFKIWYSNHVNELTKEEREYLQSNICIVKTYLDEAEETPTLGMNNE